ncbi:MAG: aspartate carbamoyltransferase catalytic subunit [Candidatus Limnocylindrales bacterium]
MARWRHRHLLDVDGLSREELVTALDMAREMAAARAARMVQARLAGRIIATVFAEASTRTRISFEIAAHALGGETAALDPVSSSLSKGESLIDTMRTLQALGVSIVVLRHPRSGAAHLAAAHFDGHVVNAGDGWHAHPTQALLDLFTLREHLGPNGLAGAKVCIVGDVLHSRVARSNIWALTTMGVDVWITGPAEFLRGFDRWAAAMPGERRLTVTGDLTEGIHGAAAVMALRVQRERLVGGDAPTEAAYAATWGLTEERLAAACPEAIVMHPGPVNEGVELPPDVVAGPRSVITRQVANGVAMRMAVLALVASTDD